MAPVVSLQNSLGRYCVLESIRGSSPYTYEGSIAAASVPIGFVERRSENGIRVDLWPLDDAPRESLEVVLGHQDSEDGISPCPVSADEASFYKDPPRSPKLAAVALVYDEDTQSVLLTRRLATMRTFPSAWVLPGGGVDTEDETLAAAALRELEEETGIRSTQTVPQPLCLWESCFPTSAKEWEEARKAGRRCAHHLIVYMIVKVSSSVSLVLQPEECDCACWVPVNHLMSSDNEQETTFPRAVGIPAGDPIPANLLQGIYPNQLGEGVGRGHRFALTQLAYAIQASKL